LTHDTAIPLENVTRLLPSLEPRERRTECGRLILTRDALHFVQGWETHTQVSSGRGMLGLLVDLAARSPDGVDTRAEGARILAEVQALAPAEQVRIVSGSFTVPATDVDSARLGLLFSVLEIVTEARGESMTFILKRRHRGAVKAWLAGLPRKR
jgi:hypothetical protein